MDIFSDTPAPTRVIWVDASAGKGGNGTAEAPYTTIQDAVKQATPGTAIMVKAGEYVENVKIPRNVSGTDDAPIWLISADGPQAAHVIAANDNKPTIVGGGTENFVVDGFWISGGKNGIQFSQNGFDYTDTIKNIVVRNNVIDSVVQDGVKLNGGNHVLVENNVISGGVDEGIDFVGIVDGVIRSNEVFDHYGKSAAIFAKGGSANIKILDNYVHNVTGDGISAGGWANFYRDMRDGYQNYEAQNVVIEGNRVESVGKRPLAFFGAGDVIATGNYLEAKEKYYTAIYVGNSNETQYGTFTSHNITIVDNFITRDTKLVFVDDGSSAPVFENNNTPVDVSTAGATLKAASVERVEVANIDTTVSDPHFASFKLVPLDQFLKMEWDEGSAWDNKVQKGKPTDGDDLITAHSQSLAGGHGDDTYQLRDGEGVVEKAGQGTDTLVAQGRYASLPDNVENLILTNKQGAVGIGNDQDNIITGSTGDDVLVGGGGHDLLTGGGGKDIFIVEADQTLATITDFAKGDTILVSASPFGTFADLQGAMTQEGSDTVIALSQERAIILRDVDASTLTAADFSFSTGNEATAPNSAETKIKAKAATHIAEGTDGADFVYGTGDAVLKGGKGDDNYIIKGAGDHIIEFGGQGVDTVLLYHDEFVMPANVENVKVRYDGDVTVVGNNQNNVIIGGDGDDHITGGVGADQLTGGNGADVFIYNALYEGGDTIDAFKVGEDKLDVRAIADNVAGVSFRAELTDAGLAVYADVNGEMMHIATLSNVVYSVPVEDLLV